MCLMANKVVMKIVKIGTFVQSVFDKKECRVIHNVSVLRMYLVFLVKFGGKGEH